MPIIPLLFLLLALTISGCYKDSTIRIPEESNKVVLNLLLNKDSLMMARVTLSGRLNERQPMPEVTNAVVNLYENGTFKETLTPYVSAGRTYYRGNTLPKSGATYRVTANIPGYVEASGSDQIPDTVKTGEMRMTVAQANNWEVQSTISVQLYDDVAVQNYYRVRLYTINEWVDSNGNGWRQKSQQYFETAEADLELFEEGNSGGEFYITDALFNGRNPRFTFKTNTGGFKKMMVEITSLTYHSYNYLNSASMSRVNNENGLSEQVIVYNNIVNGLGIIGGVAQREYVLVR